MKGMSASYDIAIIGGGPAGLTAGLYACRGRMKAVLIEKAAPGGQALAAERIENFPGFPDGVNGPDLAESMAKQAALFGLETKIAEAKNIIKERGGRFAIELAGGGRLEAAAVVIATGAKWAVLGIPGEKELAGRGVSYCATCDGPLFRAKEVVVVGGGDTALEDALFLAKFAEKVTVVHRRGRLRAAKILQERAAANKKIELALNSVAVEVLGPGKCEALRIKDVNTGKARDIPAAGVFILVGVAPNSELIKGLVKADEKGYIICDDDMRTSLDGVFACGDVRKKLLRQISTAVGDGATAAASAQAYVDRLRGEEYPHLN